MGKKEEPMIAYYEDARHFAWLVNGWICQGEKEIDEAQIKPKNIRLTGKTGSGRTTRMRSRYRDVFKEIGKVKIVLMIGTELQSFVDYSMPVRVMDYDALEYKDQIQKIASERKCRKIWKKESSIVTDQERGQIDTGYHISTVYGRRTVERSKKSARIARFF